MASSPMTMSRVPGGRAIRAMAVVVGLSCAGCATGPKPFVATEVSPGILVGGEPRGQADYDALRARGVRTIVSLQVLPWDVARGRRHAEASGFAFRNAPIVASPLKPSERRVKEALLTLRDPALRPIYLHCKLGRDRAPMIVGLYRVYYQGWTPEAAWDEMLRAGFKVRWSLRGLRTYFWSHSRKPEWVTRDGERSGSGRTRLETSGRAAAVVSALNAGHPFRRLSRSRTSRPGVPGPRLM